MKKINLLWLIPLCLFIGWTIGFYIGIPKYITLDIKTPETLKQDVNDMLDKMNNISKNMPSCSYYNITAYSGYGDYAKLYAEMKACKSQREYINSLLELCRDGAFCHCEWETRNPIVDSILIDEDKEFCINMRCGYTENEARQILHKLEPFNNTNAELNIWRVE